MMKMGNAKYEYKHVLYLSKCLLKEVIRVQKIKRCKKLRSVYINVDVVYKYYP